MHTKNPHSVYLFLRSNYCKQMLADGWEIDYIYKNNTNEKVYYIISSKLISNWTDAINNATKHGIILNENNTVIGLDLDKFNNTLYLWQAQELGLI